MTPDPAPRPLAPSLVRDLRRRLGGPAVVTDPDRLLVYEVDGLPHYRRTPSAVLLPLDTQETAWAVARLHDAGIPVVPRGAGTGLSGGAVAAPGSVVVGTARMRRILALEPSHRRARVEAGVLNADLSRAAAPHGLHYAPDPSSQTACTLGGNVAENSGGPHCLKYGVTSRYVTGLTVVAAGGRVVELGGARAAPAPDLVGLFVGSEGCFGLATEIEVRLVPVAEGVRTLLAIFGSLEEAGSAVTAVMADGLLPAALEILDRATIRAVEESIFAAGYPRDAAAVLVVEFDGCEAALDQEAERAAELCRVHGATEVRRARSEAERAQLWKGRKKAFGAMGRLAADMVVQDATVPRSRLPEVLARIEAIADTHRLRVANVFHAGDGNLHPNILFDRRDEDEASRVRQASREIMALCVEAGGTITGEHGVGLDKRDYMPLVHGAAELDALHRVRAVFDPRGLWNPGKVLPDRPAGGQDGGPAADPAPRRRPTLPDRQRLAGLADVDVGGSSTGPVVLRPRNEAALAGLLAAASAEGWSLAPGRGGAAAGGPGLELDLGGLSGIVEYVPADLTLTVRGGTPLAEVQSAAAAAGQWLPLDAPGLDSATVGGVVAAGVGGGLAGTHGGVRDLVLGLSLVTGDGHVLRLGGRVLKNVAGFDLVRLVVGSRGALGIVSAVTLRLLPRPSLDRCWFLRADRPEALVEAARSAAACPLAPASVELTWSGGEAALSVRAVGAPAAIGEVARLLSPVLAGAEILDGEEADDRRRHLRGVVPPGGSAVRVGGAPGDVDALLAEARTRAAEAGAEERGWLLVDQGVLWLGLPEGAVPPSPWSEPNGLAAEWGGALKRVFDPAGVLPVGPFGAGVSP